MTTTGLPAPTAAPTAVLPDLDGDPGGGPAVPAPAGPRPAGRLARLGIDSGYALLGLPLGILGFVLVVTGTALGLGTLVIAVGLPVLAGTLRVAGALAALGRAQLPAVLGRAVPAPRYRAAAAGSSLLRRATVVLGDPQRWLDALHAVLHLVTGTTSFALALTWWAGALGGVTYGLWDWSLPYGPDAPPLAVQVGLPDTTAWRIGFTTVLGLVLALTLPWAVRAAALVRALPARLLLSGRAATQQELDRLAGGRDAAVAAETDALRRLERDIHDGPQQRLVRLSMDLQLASRQLDRDPDAARRTLREAADQTRETLEELRALSRGIAPPVLADRGLAAALAAVVARMPVPVDLVVDLDAGARLRPAVETAAYFVVSEALANVAKHAGAQRCRVTVVPVGAGVQVSVVDDGRGGAVLAPGHGLAGLVDRTTALEGTLIVDSPPGGPTRVTARLP